MNNSNEEDFRGKDISRHFGVDIRDTKITSLKKPISQRAATLDRYFLDPFPPSPFPLFPLPPSEKGTIRIFLSSFPSR